MTGDLPSMAAAPACVTRNCWKRRWRDRRRLFAYGDPPPDSTNPAASLAFGLARNHPFVDGNKRTVAVACETFLMLNDGTLEADNYRVVFALHRPCRRRIEGKSIRRMVARTHQDEARASRAGAAREEIPHAELVLQGGLAPPAHDPPSTSGRPAAGRAPMRRRVTPPDPALRGPSGRGPRRARRCCQRRRGSSRPVSRPAAPLRRAG